MDAGRLRRGRSYVRGGQVRSIVEKGGGIEASIQGSRAAPYKVHIRVRHLTDAEWDAVVEAMAAQALFAAQLLAGEMPQAIEEAFAAAGVTLFPNRSEELETSCSCPDWANPCKHVAAAHYILGEQFDEDPFLLFRLRGRSEAQIMEALRQRRQGEGRVAEAPESYKTEPAALPLGEPDMAFWRAGPALVHIQFAIKPPATPLPALRRLGQPAFLGEDIQLLLGPAYVAVQKAAIDEPSKPPPTKCCRNVKIQLLRRSNRQCPGILPIVVTARPSRTSCAMCWRVTTATTCAS